MRSGSRALPAGRRPSGRPRESPEARPRECGSPPCLTRGAGAGAPGNTAREAARSPRTPSGGRRRQAACTGRRGVAASAFRGDGNSEDPGVGRPSPSKTRANGCHLARRTDRRVAAGEAAGGSPKGTGGLASGRRRRAQRRPGAAGGSAGGRQSCWVLGRHTPARPVGVRGRDHPPPRPRRPPRGERAPVGSGSLSGRGAQGRPTSPRARDGFSSSDTCSLIDHFPSDFSLFLKGTHYIFRV